jgi:hypothetical protein
MTEEAHTEIVIGLSDEEKQNLEKMIQTFKEAQSVETPISGAEDVQNQITCMNENLAQYVEMLLKFDAKLKSFYEIIHLFLKKDEMLNQRINVVIDMIEGRI